MADTWLLTDEQWARPRDGAALLLNPALGGVVQAWMATDSSLIVIAYPGGDEGEVWASELRDWLVALGVSSQSLRLQAGHARDDVLILTLEPLERK